MLIVLELDVLPDDVFFNVLLLFHLEHLLIKCLLKFFISVVDAELFKRVQVENFKAKDVQKPNEGKFAL